MPRNLLSQPSHGSLKAGWCAGGRDIFVTLAAFAALSAAAPHAVANPGSATAANPSVVGIYTCVDAQGRRLTRDRPIAECTDREQQELNPSGTVKRRIQATLTAREQALEDERQQRIADEARRTNEERRRDRALLARYSNEAAHDRERREVLQSVDDQLDTARGRLAEVQQQRAAVLAEVARFEREPARMPPALRLQLQDSDRDLATQQRFVAEREQERRAVQQRFDAELTRLRLLRGSMPTPATAIGGGSSNSNSGAMAQTALLQLQSLPATGAGRPATLLATSRGGPAQQPSPR